MLMGHRQAWVWQDEWHGLTISDIRELEKETQKTLAKKMGNASDPNLSGRISNDNQGDGSTLKHRPLMDISVHGSTIELLSQDSVDVLPGDQDERASEVRWRIGSFNSSDTEDEFFDAEG